MRISEYFTFLIMFIFIIGFIDTLWIFGVENSKEYTWWYVLHLLGGK